MVLVETGSAFVVAWKMSGIFLAQTLTAFAHHPGIILLYAAPAATERAWVLLRTKSVPAWWLPSLEALVILWRLLMIGIAVWVVLTPPELESLQKTLASNALIQDKLDYLGENLGKHLRILTWEIIFFAAVFFLLVWLFSRGARLWMQGFDLPYVERDNEQMALAVAARNLLLYPLAMMYAVVLIRYYLTN